MSELKNYTIIKSIGEGAFGKVKLAQHLLTGKRVAIKLVNISKAKEKKQFGPIKREVKILKKFNHPHIVKLYDLVIGEKNACLIMEFVPGGELYNLLERSGRLEENRARKYFSQVLSAVEYSHLNKVSHRDIKPENILIDSNDALKLTDFGLANFMKDGDFLNTCCGSANYAAPEVIFQNKYSGTEVDVWSLGVLLYAMTAASLPFDEPNLQVLYGKIKKGEFKVPYSFSSSLKDLIKQCLTVDPLKRITISGIKQHEWLQDFRLFLNPKYKRSSKSMQVDDGIFNFLLRNPKFSSLQDQRNALKEKIIQRKTFDLFTTSYEMLAHTKNAQVEAVEAKKSVFENICFPYKSQNCPHDWALGIRIKQKLEFIMEMIFNTLIEGELAWRIVEKFKIRVRSKDIKMARGEKGDRNKSSRSNYVKFQLNIYTLLEEYCIDFQFIEGEILVLMETFAKIWKKVQSSSNH